MIWVHRHSAQFFGTVVRLALFYRTGSMRNSVMHLQWYLTDTYKDDFKVVGRATRALYTEETRHVRKQMRACWGRPIPWPLVDPYDTLNLRPKQVVAPLKDSTRKATLDYTATPFQGSDTRKCKK